MAYFALIDANYRDQGVESDANVDQALLRAYSAILTFTAEVEKTRDENEAGKRQAIICALATRPWKALTDHTEARLWYSISAYTDQSLSKLKDSLIAQKEATKEWAQLASDLGEITHDSTFYAEVLIEHRQPRARKRDPFEHR